MLANSNMEDRRGRISEKTPLRNSKIRLFFHLSCILIFIILYVNSVCDDSSVMSVDVRWAYLPQFAGDSHLTDWHSSLFMIEGRLMTNLFLYFGVKDPSVVAIYFFWSISQIMIFLSIVIWVEMLAKKNRIYVIAFPMMGLVFLFLNCFNYYQFQFSLDLYATSILLMVITMPLFYRNGHILRNTLISIFIFILLIHLFHFRRNSVILFPVFFVYVIRMSFPSISLKKILFFLFLSLPIVPAFFYSTSLLPSKHSYPIIPMMVSDLKISAILRGEEGDEKEFLHTIGLNYDGTNTIAPLYWVDGTHVGHDPRATVKQWDELREHYIRILSSKKVSMIFAKAIQIVQFCTSGYVPQWMQRIIHLYFPKCSPTSPPWNLDFCRKNGSSYALERLIVYFFVAVCFFLARYERKQNGSELSLSLSMILSAVALAYLVSFFPITPTPDSRYHSPSMLLGGSSIIFIIIYYINIATVSLKKVSPNCIVRPFSRRLFGK